MDRASVARAVDAKRKDDPYRIFRWSLVSPEHKYLWIISPKVACVTTTLSLRVFESNPFTGGDVWEDEGVLKLRDFSTDEIAGMLTSPDWCRFCFVRNPYDKLFSAYKSKMLDPDGDPWYVPIQAEIREAFDYPIKDGKRVGTVAFRDFVRFLEAGNHRYDGHWCLQVGRLTRDLIPYDYVGRYETFQRDLRALLERLGAPPEVVATAEEVHGQSFRAPLAVSYDKELADVVYAMYREDFEAFAYDRDSWRYL
jgi:sulfotransferase famil protein